MSFGPADTAHNWRVAEAHAARIAQRTGHDVGLWALENGAVGVRALRAGVKHNPAPARIIRRPKRNPASRRDVEQASQLYEDFTGEEVTTSDYAKVRALPKVAVAIGKVRAIEYDTVRDGEPETYRHDFREHARPLFAVSHDGRLLMLLGGAYQFTERGIVDSPKS